MKRFALLFAILILTSTAFAEGRVECSSVSSARMNKRVAYCAMLPPSYDADAKRTYPVLYQLHGLGDNEQGFSNFGGWNLVEDLQRRGKIGEFIIVTPNAGHSFYVNARSGDGPYEDFFIREFIPAMEKKYRIRGTRAQRGIAGISMGGYGALRFALKYPHLFTSVTAHSAALMDKLPRNLAGGTGRMSVTGPLANAFGSPPDVQFYNRNSPFTLARQAKNLNGLKIYFDCGDRDQYGFYRGARELHELLEGRKIPHQFHIYPGGHDWRYFSEHLDESLEFHWKAFASK